MSFAIKKITLFPLKSLKGIDVDECEVDEHGLLHDRIFMLAHKRPNGEWTAVTQRSEPSMARISQKFEGDKLIVTYNETQNSSLQGRKLELPLNLSLLSSVGPNIEMELWSYGMSCRDVGTPEIRKFFVDFFASTSFTVDNLTLVVSDTRRQIPTTQKHTAELLSRIGSKTSSFQDLWPCSLMATASFDDLEEHVKFVDEETKVNINSFRMNFTIETDEAWIEDDWRKLSINGHEFLVDSPSERCPMPAVDQDKGEFRKSRHPLPSLNRYRVLEKGRAPCFGINFINVDHGFKVKVGDVLKVLETQPL